MKMERLDVLLNIYGFVRSRSEAKDLLDRGVVSIDGNLKYKASKSFNVSDFKKLVDEEKVKIIIDQYVGRGAYKLEFALEHFKIKVKGLNCLDVGSSTGGFTEVLLKNGAKCVTAVDVGTSQFSKVLLDKYNNKIKLFEKTDIRDFINMEDTKESSFDLVVCDVSFISIREIMNALRYLTKNDEILFLFKPQFEVGKEDLGKNGIVDRKTSAELILAFRHAMMFHQMYANVVESPIIGKDGNLEYLVKLEHDDTGGKFTEDEDSGFEEVDWTEGIDPETGYKDGVPMEEWLGEPFDYSLDIFGKNAEIEKRKKEEAKKLSKTKEKGDKKSKSKKK